MDTDNTQDAAEPSPASAGSRGEPVAWANADDDGIYEVGLSQDHAQYVCDRSAHGNYSHRNPRIVPLYRQPQPTLTDAEREAISRAIDSHQHRAAEMHSRSWAASAIKNDCDTLRGLLERLG